nr:MAG TPA: hypothetical protein [Caudoviricetes sp.]
MIYCWIWYLKLIFTLWYMQNRILSIQSNRFHTVVNIAML